MADLLAQDQGLCRCEECLNNLEESNQEEGGSVNTQKGSESNNVTESSQESRHEETSKEERSSISMQTGSESNNVLRSSQAEGCGVNMQTGS